MESVFVREGSSSSVATNAEPVVATPSSAAEIVQEIRDGRPAAHLEISKSLDSGFFPLDLAFRADASLRERFAAALKLPRAARYRKFRPLLFLGLIPSLMLFELDRELSADAIGGATARMALDTLLLLACAADLARPLPRHPRVTAAIFMAAAARFALLLARSCGSGAHPLVVAAPILALVVGVVTAVVSPSRDRIAADITDALGVTVETKPPAPPIGSLAGALAIGIFLPVALLVSGRVLGIWGQAVIMLAWGATLPQRAVPRVDDPSPRRSPYFSWSNVIAATVFGVALTAALTGGVHYGVDAVAHVVQCTHGAASESATHFMARETAEVARNTAVAQHDFAFFAMTVFLAPLVEERVYRGALQRVAGARLGATRAIALSAAVFGFAHLGIYRVAIYQTLLLGVAFGVAFEEGGLIAAIATHVFWNLYLLL